MVLDTSKLISSGCRQGFSVSAVMGKDSEDKARVCPTQLYLESGIKSGMRSEQKLMIHFTFLEFQSG